MVATSCSECDAALVASGKPCSCGAVVTSPALESAELRGLKEKLASTQRVTPVRTPFVISLEQRIHALESGTDVTQPQAPESGTEVARIAPAGDGPDAGQASNERVAVLLERINRFSTATRAEIAWRLSEWSDMRQWFDGHVPPDERDRLQHRHGQASVQPDSHSELVAELLAPRVVPSKSPWEADPDHWLGQGSAIAGAPVSESWLARNLVGLAAWPDTTVQLLLRLVSLTEPAIESHRPPTFRYWSRWSRDLAIAVLTERWVTATWRPEAEQVIALLKMRADAKELGSLLLCDPSTEPATLLAAAECNVRAKDFLRVVDSVDLASARGRSGLLDSPATWPAAMRARVGIAVTGRELERAAESPDPWVRLGAAANPRLGDLLEALTRDSHPEVRARAISRQEAGAPGQSRRRVLAGLPTAQEVNPALDWPGQHSGDQVAAMTERTRVAVAGHVRAPGILLQALAGDEADAVRAAVVANPNTPDEVARALGADAADPTTPPARLAELAGSTDDAVRAKVATNPAAPQATLETLGTDHAAPVRRGVAGHCLAPQLVLEALATDAAEEVRQAVATNPATQESLLWSLSRDEVPQVRRSVVAHPAASMDLLRQLAKDSDSGVRMAVASQPRAPHDAFDALARDADMFVRVGVAENPAAPRTALALLAADPESRVRKGTAENSRLPHDLAGLLADDQDPLVIGSLAENPAIPALVLDRLGSHSDGWVRNAANKAARAHQLSAAADPGTLPNELQKLAAHEALDVKSAVAGNLATPAETLLALAGDGRVSVELAAAGNPSSPVDALRRLASMPFGSGQVHSAIAGNPRTPPDLLSVLARPPVTDHFYPSGLSVTNNEPCFNLAANPNTPADVLVGLLDHPSGGKHTGNVVWTALAANPAAPPAVVQRLAELGVAEVLDRPDLSPANLVSLCGVKGTTHTRGVAELVVRYAYGELGIDSDLLEGLFRAGGDARRLVELIASNPSLPLEAVAAAATAGVSAKVLLNVPVTEEKRLSDSGLAAKVVSAPGEFPDSVKLRAACCASGAALRKAAASEDPVVRWGAASSPRAGTLLGQLVTDPDPRVRAQAARRVAEALR